MNSPEVIGNCKVLYNHNGIIAVNKCTGTAVIPARGEDPGLSLRWQVEKALGQRIYTIHRIDRATSGIVLFVKNSRLHRELCTLFENREIKKVYRAVVLGAPPQEAVCCDPIKAFGSGRMGVHSDGKLSETHFKVLERFDTSTLLNVVLKTGRRHQIRVHLYNKGFPVIGDPLYGENRPVGGAERMMLHAYSVEFTFRDGNYFSVTAPVDECWNRVLLRMKNWKL